MKMTVDIPEAMLAEAMRHTGAKTMSEATVMAVEEYNRLQRLADLPKPL